MLPISTFIFRNFSLFGFDSSVNSLVQLVTELVDNSVDACRISVSKFGHGFIPKIKVSIRLDDQDPNLLAIEVSDTGIGMDHPETLFECFQTTRTTSTFDLSLIGKFGVGLSVSLIYSYHVSHRPAKLVTYSANSHILQAADIILNEDGIPTFMNKLETPNASSLPTFGTLIRMYIPTLQSTDLRSGKIHKFVTKLISNLI